MATDSVINIISMGDHSACCCQQLQASLGTAVIEQINLHGIETEGTKRKSCPDLVVENDVECRRIKGVISPNGTYGKLYSS